MSRPRAAVLAAPGTNRDRDVCFALERAGATAETVRIARLAEHPRLLRDVSLLVVAGGFSHADAFGAGRMFALDLQTAAGDELARFVAAGRPVLGICNGFQALVRAGLLPGALGHNLSGGFQCEWVTLDPTPGRCIWTDGLDPIDCPIAHGEGRYVHPDLDSLSGAGQVALRYRNNPNGSAGDVAGVCDASGVVLGLMPHPENHVIARQHPLATRGGAARLALGLFERGVRHARSC